VICVFAKKEAPVSGAVGVTGLHVLECVGDPVDNSEVRRLASELFPQISFIACIARGSEVVNRVNCGEARKERMTT
jgi:hypothetical protein